MPIVAPNNTDMWPSLIEAHNQSPTTSTILEEEEHHQQQEQKHHQEDESGWEMIGNTSIHRSVSSPNFSSSSIALLESSTEDDQSSDHSSFVELAENDTSIIVDQDTDCDGFVLPTPPQSPTPKPITAQSRTPSFRDAILLNAERQMEEEMKREEMERREAEERLKQKRKNRGQRRIVVVSGGSGMGMRRCAKSTGDLRMMVKIEEDCDGGGGGGGGRGGGSLDYVEEEVLGETDAPDYYDRKSAGRASRKNGAKLRPDEAKRKAGIVAKKNAQRREQGHKKEESRRNRR